MSLCTLSWSLLSLHKRRRLGAQVSTLQACVFASMDECVHCGVKCLVLRRTMAWKDTSNFPSSLEVIYSTAKAVRALWPPVYSACAESEWVASFFLNEVSDPLKGDTFTAWLIYGPILWGRLEQCRTRGIQPHVCIFLSLSFFSHLSFCVCASLSLSFFPICTF